MHKVGVSIAVRSVSGFVMRVLSRSTTGEELELKVAITTRDARVVCIMKLGPGGG
jgi:hypothetical protein